MGFDEYMGHAGLLINKSGEEPDGGDTAQMTGLYRFFQYIKYKKDSEMRNRIEARFEQECDMLTYVENILDKDWTVIKTIPHPGTHIRHPAPIHPAWATNPKCFSRDQQRSLIVAMGALRRKKKLWQVFWKHVKRFGWYQNNEEIDGTKKLADFAAPDILGEYIRAFWMSMGILGRSFMLLLYPILFLTDISAFIGFLTCFYKWRNPDEADDDNLLLTILQAKNAMPTPISWLIRKLYKRFRPKCGGLDLPGPQSAIAWKHRVETGSPPFAELINPILDKEL